MRAIKVRVYPTKSQVIELNQHFGCVRYIYNKALALKIGRYKEFKENLSIFEISKMITFWKKTDELSFLKEANAQSLQQCLRHLDRAYKSFFKGGGFPKFKKRSSNQSYSVVGPVSVIDNKIKFPKLGLLDCRGLRKFEGDIKTATISKNCSNQYFVSFCIDDIVKGPVPKIIKKAIGIDLGLKDFLITNEGLKVSNPRFFKEVENKIKYYQRRMAKSVKGSNSFKKWKLKAARLWQKINNLKSNFLHQLSYKLVKNHDLICVEDLKVSNMIKNRKLAKAISSVSWGEFIRQLKYKSEWYGTILEIVDPKYTSQNCSTINCNYRNKELTLKNRSWKCPVCNTIHDRDINASKNILIKGMDSILKSSGDISISLVNETRITCL
jgi:putative transposase